MTNGGEGSDPASLQVLEEQQVNLFGADAAHFAVDQDQVRGVGFGKEDARIIDHAIANDAQGPDPTACALARGFSGPGIAELSKALGVPRVANDLDQALRELRRRESTWPFWIELPGRVGTRAMRIRGTVVEKPTALFPSTARNIQWLEGRRRIGAALPRRRARFDRCVQASFQCSCDSLGIARRGGNREALELALSASERQFP